MRAFTSPLLFLASSIFAFGCGGDDSSGNPSGTGSGGSGGAGTGGQGGGATAVTLQFEGRVGQKVFSCADTQTALGTPPSDVKITDFRLYIHDIRLHAAGGGDVPVTLEQDGLWQYQDLALLDFEDKTGSCANGTGETNGAVHATAPKGTYDGVSFKLGVPFALNHADAATAPSPLNLSGLFWSWNGGYKFLRVDSVPAAGGMPFNIHIGSTGCMGDFANGGIESCDRPNVAEITLTGFDPTTTKILVDYAALVATSDLATNAGNAPGCMSESADPECAAVFQGLGIDVADGSLHPELQKLFRVE